MSQLPPAIFIMGPTASGKTDLAVELVARYNCQIISVDSALVYQGMNIGTAKPDAETLARAPHRLIDFLDPAESYSAAQFRRDALEQMAQITAEGDVPVLVGGTMLYHRALLYGLAELPNADQEIRQRLEQEARSQGWETLHKRLAQIDPESAKRIHPNDPQRIQRALEVYEITGRSMSELHKQSAHIALPYHSLKLVVAPKSRDLLRARIAERFHLMLEQGLVEEVRALYQRGDLHPDLPSMRSVGYRQVWDYLAGQLSYDEMVERAITITRQFAKRQMTWLRKEQDAYWLESGDPHLFEKALKYIEGNLNYNLRQKTG